jgi:1,4-alpha-glucan branching enzyme
MKTSHSDPKKCSKSGKLSFDSRGEAWDFVKNMRGNKTMKIYECHCGKFHTTKQQAAFKRNKK